ncbi:MAG TPA: pyruvate formate-lyase-activating protein [Marinilabiliaceae bacterium]|nr:pyruvate formate-lyase-activating protein [Marinilabiliaceae bacterium]
MLRVHSIESLGTFDGPGIRQVLFLQGCNFKCLYCANPDTIEFAGGKEYETDDLAKMALSQRPFYGKKGGVTVSGGEPLMQAQGLLALFSRLKSEGINTCIDTNGSILTPTVKGLLEYTDLVLLDIKQIDNEKHKNLTGVSNERTLAFVDYLSQTNHPTWIRYVMVPGYSNDDSDLHALGKHLSGMRNIEKLEIQPYHKLGVHKYESMGWKYQLLSTPTNTLEELENAKTIFSQYVKEVVIN